MGLFSTLLNASHNTEDAATTSKNTSKSSSEEVPTVIQLFTKYPIPIAAVDTAAVAAEVLDTNKKQQTKKKTYRTQQQQYASFAPLQYTAVQCCSTETTTLDLSSTTSTGLRHNNKKKDVQTKLLTPDLGIWNCRVDDGASNTMSDAMLPLATATNSKNNNTLLFCMAVDLAHPQAVEPTIATLQQALVRYLIQYAPKPQHQHEESSGVNVTTTTATTSLYQLETVQFGLADKDKKSAEKMQSAADEKDKEVKIALQICVMQATAAEDDYKAQQHGQLLTYHLRKYAAAVNASLVFVETETDGSTNHELSNAELALPNDTAATPSHYHQQPTVTTRELPILWKALANGKPVWKYDSVEAMEAAGGGTVVFEAGGGADTTEEAATTTSGYSLVYGPDNHHPELVETVLLRNAVYPGHWDAATDSVWKILPPAAAVTATDTKRKVVAVAASDDGDQAWLKELRDSVAPAATADSGNLQTPPPKNKQSDASKTPNDAAVSSFFEGLLK